MRVAYADPPYPGMSHFYKDHSDYGGEVDPGALVERLCDEYDAWALHTASTTLQGVLEACPGDVRVGAWVKTFASFKPGVNPAYAWEPVISSKGAVTVVDWIAHPITLRKGLTGAKPPAVIEWVFRVLGLDASDAVSDLFPGTGVVGRTWAAFTRQPELDAKRDARVHTAACERKSPGAV